MTGHRVKTQDTLISGMTRAVSINYNKYRTIGHQVKTQSIPLINPGQLGIKSRPRIHSYIPANSELPISGLSLTTNMPDTPAPPMLDVQAPPMLAVSNVPVLSMLFTTNGHQIKIQATFLTNLEPPGKTRPWLPSYFQSSQSLKI